MHPIVRRFSERRPKLYGLIMLGVAVTLVLLGQRITAASIAFLVLMLGAGFGVGGIYYLALGSQAQRYDVRFEGRYFPPAALPWRQVCTAIALGLGLLCITGALYWLLR